MKPFLPALVVMATALLACPSTNSGTCEFDSDCQTGFRCCGTECKDIRADPENCGACGAVCPSQNGTASCVAATCKILCEENRGNCDNDLANGCEVNFLSSKSHCGACGNACSAPNAAGVCNSGQCGMGLCNGGFANCDMVASNGCETNTTEDADHCGQCNNKCVLEHATAQCVGSGCQVATCDTGWGNCNGLSSDGCESNLTNDEEHCGDCETACSSGEQCVSGKCQAQSLVGFGGTEETGTLSAEVWRFDPSKKLFETVMAASPNGAPEPRFVHAAAWDKAASRMIIFGGNTESKASDSVVWALDFTTEMPTWTKLPMSMETPGGRAAPCYGHDMEGRVLWLFGGIDEFGADRQDFWKLDLSNGVWTRIHDDSAPGTPPPAAISACAYVPETGMFVRYGEIDPFTGERLNSLWGYDTQASSAGWTNLKVGNSPTQARGEAKFFEGLHPVALFGGSWFDQFSFQDRFPNDVNVLEVTPGLTWNEESPDNNGLAPLGRISHATAVLNGKRYLYGGQNYANFNFQQFDDVWEFDPMTKTWTELSASGASGAPSGKLGASMVAPR